MIAINGIECQMAGLSEKVIAYRGKSRQASYMCLYGQQATLNGNKMTL